MNAIKELLGETLLTLLTVLRKDIDHPDYDFDPNDEERRKCIEAFLCKDYFMSEHPCIPTDATYFILRDIRFIINNQLDTKHFYHVCYFIAKEIRKHKYD